MAEEQRAETERRGYFPVDAASAVIKPGSENAGEDKAEQRRAHGHVRGQTGKGSQGGDEKNAADSDSADKGADDKSDEAEEKKMHGIPACVQIFRCGLQTSAGSPGRAGFL